MPFNYGSIRVYTQGTTESVTESTIEGTLLPELDLTTESGRTVAAEAIDAASTFVDEEMSNIGAKLSRLEVTSEMLLSQRDNYAVAAERIRTIDVAEEVAKLTRLQIIQDAAAAVLAQANQEQRVVLRLLEESLG